MACTRARPAVNVSISSSAAKLRQWPPSSSSSSSSSAVLTQSRTAPLRACWQGGKQPFLTCIPGCGYKLLRGGAVGAGCRRAWGYGGEHERGSARVQASYQPALDGGSLNGQDPEGAGGLPGVGEAPRSEEEVRRSTDEEIEAAKAAVGGALPLLNYSFHRQHVKPPSFGSRVTYLLQKVLVGAFTTRALVLLMFSLTSGVIAGLMMKLVEGGSMKDACWQAFCILHDCPGADMMFVESVIGRLLMMGLFYVGVFILAVFLGVMADEVRTRIDMVKDSNLRVLENDHNVIIGWSRLSIPLLQQAEALACDIPDCTWRRPIVMLLRNAEERDLAAQEIAYSLPNTSLQIILRTGQPTKLSDLGRVRAGQAQTVVYLDPDHVEDYQEFSVYKAAATLALVALRISQAIDSAQTFVMQAANRNNLFQRAQQEYSLSKGQMVGVARLNAALGSLVGVCALQPGLGAVFSDLIQVQPGASAMVYIREMPEFVGRRHKEIWRAFNDAVVTGYLHDKSKNCVPCDLSFTLSEGQATKSDRLVLNPHEDYIMQPGDKMVVVSRNAKRVTEKVPVPPKRDEAELCEAPPFSLDLNCSHCSETEIVLISCDSVLDTILHSITEFALQKATVTVLVQPECEEQSHIPELIKDCREKGIELRVLKGDWCSEQVLYDAGVHTCSSIVLGSKFQDDVDEEHDHDAQLVSQLLLIKRTREEAYVRHAMTDPGCGEGKPLHVVGLSTYKDTQTLADVLSMSTLVPITVDLLNLDELMSGWITQVATQPAVAYFFREILATSLGCEIYVRKAVNYFPDTARDSEEAATSFRTIQEGARLHSETAIGFIQKGSRKVLLGAMANATVTLDDRVVVVAED